MPSIKTNITKAFFYCLGYSLLLSVMSLFGKLAAPHTTNSLAVFSRFSVSLVYIMMIFSIQHFTGRKKFALTTKQPFMHILRASSSFGAMLALFYALRFIPIADANLLFMTNPLFIPILGAIFLHITTDKKNWLAIIIGFIGVACILKPGHEMLNSASLIGLASGFFAAISLLGIHELGKKDSVHTIIFYYFFLTFILSGVLVLFNWQTPDLYTTLLLLGIGISGALCQECSVRALINAPAKIVAPLMYISIIFSGLFDWIFWKHTPNLPTIIGIVIVCSSSILTLITRAKKSET